ncbi:MAG TPA: YggS family pyridoxal phosphate-dependent enzyme [Mycobacteriales bacterium]
MTAADPQRREALAGRLAGVRDRIAGAARAAGRPADDVTLVAVTKTFPAADVLLLAGLGVTEVAENRDQEASAKAAEVAAALGDGAPRWHFVGRLQRNKARSVVRYADVVESVDRPQLVEVLSAAAVAHREEPLDALVQVSFDDAPGRGGAAPADVPRLADTVAAAPGLRLAGLMAVAPLGADPEPAFARLAEIAGRLHRDHPGASVLSAGMSGDLEAAVAYGATHVRVGTALLGGRPPAGR